MEFNFSLIRIGILAVLLAGFAAVGGFDLFTGSASHFNRGAGKCIALFIAGAVSATLVDHYVGNLERTNLRLLYILGGIALMGGAVAWLLTLKQVVAGE
jgi:hypothetical protein